jgi:hypothetical protein
MDLICRDSITPGACLEISESGLRGTFSGSVAPGSKGLLTLYKDERRFQAHVVVLSFRNDEARIKFRFQSRDEILAIRDLVYLLSLRP